MRVRLELFVEDMETSIGFYTRVPGFEVARNEAGPKDEFKRFLYGWKALEIYISKVFRLKTRAGGTVHRSPVSRQRGCCC